MSNKPLRVVFTNSQFKSILKILELSPNITRSFLFSKLDITEFKDNFSVYHLVNYKVYDVDIKKEWKQYRGIIIKDYEKIVCSGVGHTPNIALEGKLSECIFYENGKSFLRVSETLENKMKEVYDIPITEGKIKIRPAFQGSIVRIWLSNNIMYRSTLKNPYLDKAKWMGDSTEDEKKERLTFGQKFNTLCDQNRDAFFKQGVKNSPFCHIFIMVTPQVASFSHVDCGEGYLMYLETKECYEPIRENPDEEEESFLLREIPKSELSSDEIAVGVKREIDRFVFPLHRSDADYPLSNFIPPPSTKEYLEKNSAIYRLGNSTMSIGEADEYLIKGVSVDLPDEEVAKLRETFPYQMVYKRSDIRRLKKEFPFGLPGEALYCTSVVNGEIKTYLLTPQCSLYRAAMVRDPNSRISQLVNLRSLAIAPPRKPTGNLFYGLKTDLDTMEFEDLCMTQKTDGPDYFYLGIDNTSTDIIPPTPENSFYLPNKESFGIIPYPIADLKGLKKESGLLERNNYWNSRWFIIAFHYCLAMTPHRRKEAWESFRTAYTLYTKTLTFISENYEDIIDEKSVLYTNKGKAFPLSLKSPHGVAQRMKDIILKAKTAKYSREIEDEPDNLPDDGSEPVVIKMGRIVTKTSYAEAFGLPGSEMSPTLVAKNIRNLLRKEEGSSLNRIMKVVKTYIRDNP